nr:MAG TPA: hypothetical protein [Bacteriophage sp.]
MLWEIILNQLLKSLMQTNFSKKDREKQFFLI